MIQMTELSHPAPDAGAIEQAEKFVNGLFGKCQSPTVIHRIEYGGAIIPRTKADHLHGALTGMSSVLFHSMLRQIETGVGDLDRREKVRTLMANLHWEINADRAGDVKVVVYASRNSPAVFFGIDGHWSGQQRPTLVWTGRNGVALSAVNCQTIIDAPYAERVGRAAGFTHQRIRLENRFAEKRVLAAAAGRTSA
ncbi:hypothetical protein [Brevundimonas diminuta]|uniref:hypothetical protein n=1 Tax=Brevundimonas diminuta TaxID=293 RepID=UPI000B35E936|nr:hypothetical protein [Brevundimonas diminuta]